MPRVRLPGIVLSLALFSCARAPTSPDGAFRAFAAAYARGDADAAWTLLSKATQDRLTSAAKSAAKAENVKAPKDGRVLMFESNRLPRDVKDVAILAVNGERATVAVVDDGGGRQTVGLVREHGRWRVDLANELARAAAP